MNDYPTLTQSEAARILENLDSWLSLLPGYRKNQEDQ